MGTFKVDGHIEGNYIKANWLYTSAATAKTSVDKIACIGSDNFIYYITPTNMNVGRASILNKYATKLNTDTDIDAFLGNGMQLTWIGHNITGLNNDGAILSIGQGSGWGAQLWIDDGSGNGGMAVRSRKSTTTWNDWKPVLTSANYTSYTVTKTGSGASGTWGIDITGTAAHANYLNTVAGNEIRFHNATGLTAGGSLWLGWAWADGNKTVTKDWYIGNFSGGGLANIYASTFNGALRGNATSATYVKDSYNGSNITITYGKSGQSSTSWLASWNGYELGAIQPSNITAGWASGAGYSNSSNALASTGWGNTNFTYLQQSGDFYGNSGWSHYLISNHGDGSSYYNYVIALPFWSYPKYKRMSGGSESSWYNFYTTENVIIQSATPGAGFYGQIWFKI